MSTPVGGQPGNGPDDRAVREIGRRTTGRFRRHHGVPPRRPATWHHGADRSVVTRYAVVRHPRPGGAESAAELRSGLRAPRALAAIVGSVLPAGRLRQPADQQGGYTGQPAGGDLQPVTETSRAIRTTSHLPTTASRATGNRARAAGEPAGLRANSPTADRRQQGQQGYPQQGYGQPPEQGQQGQLGPAGLLRPAGLPADSGPARPTGVLRSAGVRPARRLRPDAQPASPVTASPANTASSPPTVSPAVTASPAPTVSNPLMASPATAATSRVGHRRADSRPPQPRRNRRRRTRA